MPQHYTLYEFTVPCEFCGENFRTRRKYTKYCTGACAKLAHKARAKIEKRYGPGPNLNSGNRGAVSELIASADLIQKGFEVFRSVSPTTSCDLIALRNGILFRIEVRTAYRNKVGNLMYAKNQKPGRMDIYAAVCGYEVIYIPPLPD